MASAFALGSTKFRRRPRQAIALLVAVLLCAGLVVAGVAVIASKRAGADITTNSADNLRDGWYSNQPALSSAAVAGSDFGQLGTMPVVGQVYAQPVISNNVMVVATEHNTIYGFNPATRQQLWTDNVGTTFDAAGQLGCTDISPEVGITSTPVIDPATGTAYVMSKAYLNGSSTVGYYLHAIDVQTGAEKPNFPVQIQGTANNYPSQSFNAYYQLQRPGLLLLNGVVYAGFSGHCDAKPYQGWITGVSTSTAKVTAMWSDETGPNVDPTTGGQGGIWQSGGGLVSDASGDIVFATGNGDQNAATGDVPPIGPFSASTTTLAQSIVRLHVQSDGTLKPTDYFAPYDAPAINNGDADLGSGAPIALPSQFGTAAYPRLIVEVGKEAYMTLHDATNLGGRGQGPAGGDKVLSRVGPLQGGGVRGKPAAYGGADGKYVYVTTSAGGATDGKLLAYSVGVDGSGNPTLTAAGVADESFGFGSSAPVVTSDGTTAGSGLVWATSFPHGTGGVGATLNVYKAVPVNGKMVLLRSFPLGKATKFAVPVADSGRIYLGAADGNGTNTVYSFGAPVQAPLSGSTATFPTTIVGSTSTGTATVTAGSALTVTGVSSNSAAFVVQSPTTPALPATLAAGQTLQVPLQFKPTSSGQIGGTLSFTTSLGPAAISMSGLAQVNGPQLTQYPCCLAFGGIVAGGQPATNTVSFSSTGSKPLVINSYTLPSAPFTVSGLPAAGTTLASGQSFTATFTFAPQSVGNYDDYFGIQTNDPNAPGGSVNDSPAPGGVILSGSGGTQPVMRLTPQSLNYGSVPIGVTATHIFSITNTGGTDLHITISKTPTGDFAAQTNLDEGTVIAAGTSITERVNYTPTSVGTSSSVWAITGDDGGERQDVSFTGTGTAAALPNLSVGDLDVNRPTSGTIVANVPVTLDHASTSPVTVSYSTKDGTATAASGDYVATSGTLTFAAGDTTKTIPVTINGSQPTATAETLTVNLANVSGAVSIDGSAKLYLTGAYLPVSVGVDDTTAPAAATGATTLAFPVTVNPAPYPGQSVTVTVATADTATATSAAGDYTPVNTTLTFTNSTPTQTVNVSMLKPPASGASKAVSLVLSNASAGTNVADATALGTVYGSTATKPLPSLNVSDTAVSRPTSGTVGATFTVRLSPASTQTVSVVYGASGGSGGITSADYAYTQGTLNFLPGDTTKTVTVAVNGSTTSTGTGTFNFNLSKNSQASLGDAGSKAYIVSPLVHAFASVKPATAWISPYEDTTVNVPIVLNAPAASPVTLTATTSDGTAVAGTDYASTTATVTIPAGASSTLLPVTILHQAAVQPSKKFTVTLSGQSGATQLSSSTASVTLVSHTSDTTVPSQNSAPTFTAATPPTTSQSGTAYDYTFSASGVPTPSYAVASGSLPAGLTLNALSGELSGTPNTAGTFTFTISANNNVGSPAVTGSLTITVTAPSSAPAFTAASPPSPVTQNSSYSYQFTASGNPAPTFAVASGSLPPGTSLSSSGLLSGAPSTAGTYTFTVSATNGVGSPAVTGSLSITVNPAQTAPAFTAASPNPNATVGSAYSYAFAASGSPAPTFSVASGALPSGLTLSSAGALTGTPTAAGTFTFAAKASNAAGQATTGTLTITVSAGAAAPVFTASSPGPNATVGTAYSYTFTASGNPAPTFSVATGAIPAGLTLASGGALTGTPSTAGTYSFTVKATNSAGSATTGQLTITVAAAAAAPVFTSSSPPANATVNTAYSYTFAATGNPAPSYSVGSGTLPTGLNLNAASGQLAGTPTAAGTYTFTVQASNGVNPSAVTPSITITVSPQASGSADIAVTISGPSGVTLGSNLTWSLNVHNNGPTGATSVSGSIKVPAGMTFVSADSGYTLSNGTVSWTQPSLSSGSAMHWKLTVKPTAKGTFTTTGSGSSATPDPDTSNNSTTSAGVPVK